MKRALVLSFVMAMAMLLFAVPMNAFETDLIVGGELLANDLLFSGPGGLYFGGDAVYLDGLSSLDLYLGGNGTYLDAGLGISNTLLAPALNAFAVYSDRYLDGGLVGLVTGLSVAFEPFAYVQTPGIVLDSPFVLSDFDLFLKLELDIGGLFELDSRLTAYLEFDVLPVWDEDAWTTGTSWAFGFCYQWVPGIPQPPDEQL